MRILVVGAGAVGGFFGGHLADAGRDITFLVRDARAARLRADGLVVETLRGPLRVEPAVVTAAELPALEPFDLVLLSVKAFGLEQAMDDLAPAVGPGTTVVPLLNGLRHIETLQARFGDERVVGGLCFVATTLEGDVVRQLGPLQTIRLGELDGSESTRILAAHHALDGAGFEAVLSTRIEQDLWEKWFILAAGGVATTLLGGNVGAIEAAPHGRETALAVVAECAAVAAASGHEPRPAMRERAVKTLTEAGSDFTTSLYRDRAAGLEIESEQIVGDLVRRARERSVSVPLLTAAAAALEVYRAQRTA
jgi:2-dehydropantoate 2-reductase